MGQLIAYQGVMPDVAAGVFIADGARIIGNVKLRKGANIWFNTVLRGDIEHIEVGQFTNLQDNVTVHVMSHAATIIGDYVTVGHGAIIHCSRIGNNCLIGMGAILLGYAEIGENCVIGAGTLLTEHKKIPAKSMVYGNPARIVRTLRDDEIEAVHQSAVDYYDIARKYFAGALVKQLVGDCPG